MFCVCIMSLLCRAGAHPALSDANGWIPLHYACENEHLECVRAIVTLGGKLGVSGLKSALSIAETGNLGEIAAVLRDANERYLYIYLSNVYINVYMHQHVLGSTLVART